MTHIRTDLPGPAETHLGVHIGAIHVYLATDPMHGLTDFPNARLEHAVGGGVGHHERGKAITVLSRLLLEIDDIDVAGLIAANRHDFKTGHDRAGGIGPMR